MTNSGNKKRTYDKLIDGDFHTVEVVRTGRFKSSNSASDYYILTEQNIDEIVASANNAEQPITIDYNHSAFSLGNVTPEQTVAAGYHHNWGWEKRANKDGSFSAMAVKNTEWTPKAKQFIRNGEYRFISSVLMFDSANGETRTGAKIIGSSLVPIPNIKGMDAVMLNNAKQKVKLLSIQMNEDSQFEIHSNQSILLNMDMDKKEQMMTYLNELKAVMEDLVGEPLTEENGSTFIEKAKDMLAKAKTAKKATEEKQLAEENASRLAKKQIELMGEKSTLIAELNSLRQSISEKTLSVVQGIEDATVQLLSEIALNTGKITPAQFNNEEVTVELNGIKKTIKATHPIKPIFKGFFASALQEENGDTSKAFTRAINDTKAYIAVMPNALPSQTGTAPSSPKQEPPKPSFPIGDGDAVEINADSLKALAEIDALIEKGKDFATARREVLSKMPAYKA